jgi:hypothetical protein
MAVLEFIARKLTTKVGHGAPIAARATGIESAAVDQVAPPKFELSRAGRRFHLAYNGTAPSGIAPVQALPTTAAQWAIWNADKNRALLMETLGLFPFSGTPGVGGVLLACLFAAPAQTGAQAAGIVVANMSNGGLASKAFIKSGVTITDPAAGLWMPVAENPSPNVGAFPGSGIIANRNLQGSIIVPPQMGLGLVALALAGTTPLFGPIAEWSEIEADLE